MRNSLARTTWSPSATILIAALLPAELQSLVLAAGNPEFALAQYRMLVAHLSQLAAIADAGYIARQLQVSGQSTELERTIWEHVEKTRPES